MRQLVVGLLFLFAYACRLEQVVANREDFLVAFLTLPFALGFSYILPVALAGDRTWFLGLLATGQACILGVEFAKGFHLIRQNPVITLAGIGLMSICFTFLSAALHLRTTASVTRS